MRRKKAGQEQLKAREEGIPSTQISEREIKGKCPGTTLKGTGKGKGKGEGNYCFAFATPGGNKRRRISASNK